MRQKLLNAKVVVVLYIIAIIVLWVNMGETAEYATYMRVVGFNALYVKVIDMDGKQWEIARKDDTLDLKKGDMVMVVMDLEYRHDLGVFMIGHSYIEDKL